MNKSHRSPLRSGARSIYAGLLDALFVTAHVLVGYATYAGYDWVTTELYPLGATLLAAPVLPPPSLCRTLFSTPSPTDVHVLDAPHEGIFVMRNGANVGRAMTWVSVGAPGDDCVAPFSRAAAHVLGVSGPDVFAPITLYDDAGHEIAPTFASIVAAKRVHLLLHGEVWVWPGIALGHEWTADGYAMRTLSLSPTVILVRDFLDDSECSALVEGGRDLLGPSHTVDKAANHRLALRTSSTAFIGHVAGATTIKERATRLARLPDVSYTEDLQLVRYGPGQWYKKHTDYFQHLDVSSHARAGTSLAHWVRWVQAQIGRTASLSTTHPLYPSLSSAFERSFALLLLERDAIQDKAVVSWLRHHLEHEYLLSSLLAAWSPTNPLLFATWRRVWEDAVGIPALQWRDPLQLKYVEPNRHATLFLYLNDVAHGGETVFPYGTPMSTTSTTTTSGMPECARGLSVKPVKRAGVLFYNKAPTGENDPRSMHGGCPPQDGDIKWGSNVFMWNVEAAYGNKKWRFW
ncbi:hypothetical protein SPRG_18505 [Saprolegnia parasitica CBS 223.65]|uniref:Prolyl 4-hydroxylase alpha subunit domain-containing protein n=1 Tax=Saprolegnia parasitica (strain CBS 223.65) TaxID=695850 RepID=A0A067BMK2_SAPPC|nr:hypothetical protein SPRG_18505 [Saprolegnia parasitica CBS 223.65]KDO15962.1 hypothetical protein SPRG_18505 [Saprolegnia parasitica CBS 223.65]|eukprot:XP_012213330.1 hypothetical protein SPRG_18505 [Saprolegnia parasitica CBS 223.65]